MRILRVHNVLQALGGAERYILHTSHQLESMGHDVFLVSPDDDPDRLIRPGRRDITIPRAHGFRTSRRTTRALLATVEELRPDVAIIHNTVEFLTAGSIRALARKVPTAKHIHDARVFCPRILSKILPQQDPHGLPLVCEYPAGARCITTGCLSEERKGPTDVGPLHEQLREFCVRLGSLAAIRRLPGIIVDSHYMANEARRNRLGDKNIHVLGQISLQEPTGPRMASDLVRITAIGRWDDAKGFPSFLEVLLDRARTHSFHANLVGVGPGLDAGRALVEAAGLEERIRIRGGLGREEMEMLYRETDVVAIPTCIPESFGIVGLEAHAHGLPVVAFALGGINDWLISGETGISVPLGDWESFGQSLMDLCKDPDLRDALGKAGAQQRREEYSIDAHMERLVCLLEDITAA